MTSLGNSDSGGSGGGAVFQTVAPLVADSGLAAEVASISAALNQSAAQMVAMSTRMAALEADGVVTTGDNW